MLRLFQVSLGHSYSSIRNCFRDPRILSSRSLSYALIEAPCPKSKLDFILNEVKEYQYSKPRNQMPQPASETDDSSDPSCLAEGERAMVQISHPWPEWVGLMELLFKRGYMEGDGNPFRDGELGAKDSNLIRTGCLNFARDRYDLIRFLSRKDMRVITEFGCPSTDRKVVNSGKRLRAHVGVDEGNVCSGCNLRGDCERAYVKARQEGGRTVDVMRILLTYGLDPIAGRVENKPLLNKLVKESVRSLMTEMVEYSAKELDSDLPIATPVKRIASAQDNSCPSEKGQLNVPMKQGDWLCPKCNFLNFAKNVKCLRCDGLFQERLRQLHQDQDHLPLKKGDWICDKCNFLNFAKNTRCLQCKEKPPKRQLNPGEWECDSCNYINFRRNMVCLQCDHRRPKALSSSKPSAQSRHDDTSFHKKGEVSFSRVKTETNDQPSVGKSRKTRDKSSIMWQFVDNSEDSACSRSSNKNYEFEDFPIAGGKSDLSQNAQRRERWKLEMQERSEGTINARPEDDEPRHAHLSKMLNFPESTDDEEMADWFSHRSA